MKRQALRNIQNLQELEAARQTVGTELNRCRKTLGKDMNRVQNMFKPMNLVGAGWQLMAPKAQPLQSILLGLVRRAKSLVKNF